MGLSEVIDKRLMGGIGRLGHEGDGAAVLGEPLQSGVLAVDEADGDLAVFHFWLAADDDNVAVLDPSGVHAVAPHPEAEILCAAVEVGVGVALDILLGVDGGAGGDTAQDRDALEVGEVDGGGVWGEGPRCKRNLAVYHSNQFININTNSIRYISVHFNGRSGFFSALGSVLFQHGNVGLADTGGLRKFVHGHSVFIPILEDDVAQRHVVTSFLLSKSLYNKLNKNARKMFNGVDK